MRDLVEEALVELRFPGRLVERAHLHPGGVHVDQERRDALVLGHVGVGARDEKSVGRLVSERRPDLLSRDDPLVPVELCTHRECRHVRSGARFGEELTPDLLTGEQRSQETLLLLVGTVGDDRRGAHAVPDDVSSHRGRRVESRHAPKHVELLGGARSQTAQTHREVRPRQAPVELLAEEGDRVGRLGRERRDEFVNELVDRCFGDGHGNSFVRWRR